MHPGAGADQNCLPLLRPALNKTTLIISLICTTKSNTMSPPTAESSEMESLVADKLQEN